MRRILAARIGPHQYAHHHMTVIVATIPTIAAATSRHGRSGRIIPPPSGDSRRSSRLSSSCSNASSTRSPFLIGGPVINSLWHGSHRVNPRILAQETRIEY